MNTMFYVVCIVVVVFAADSYQKYLKMQQQKKQEHDPELEKSLAKIDMLEERIRVLERIVTENKRDIGREIDGL
jgi:cell division protein FtsB